MKFILLLSIFLCRLCPTDLAVEDEGCLSLLRKKFCMRPDTKKDNNGVFKINVLPPTPRSTKTTPTSSSCDTNFLSVHSASSPRFLIVKEDKVKIFHPFAMLEKREKIIIDSDDMRVLIADSQKFSYYTLRFFCEAAGVENSNIVWAENGADAIHEFKKCRPHLVFVDKNMPASDLVVSDEKTIILRDGLDAILRIRKLQDELGINPVIIAISDDNTEKTIDELKDAGADDVLIKPFTPGSSNLFSHMLGSFFEFFDF